MELNEFKMGEKKEYLIGSFFLLLAAVIYGYNNWLNEDMPNNHNVHNEKEIRKIERNFLINAGIALKSDTAKDFLFFINSKVCSPCLTNVEEYIHVIENLNEPSNIGIFYLSKDEEFDSKRLNAVMDWKDYYEGTIQSEEYTQNKLIFIKDDEIKSVSTITPNVVTSMDQKEKIIKAHLNN